METRSGNLDVNYDEKLESDDSDDEDYYIRPKNRSKKPDRLNGEYSYQNTIKKRLMGQPCFDCKMKCDLRIVERFRQDNYLNFWGKLKDWEERRLLLRRLVQVLRVPHPKDTARKKFLRKYYLEIEDGLTLVCKTMFFNTLAISVKFIETTLQKYPDNILDESKIKLVNCPSVTPKPNQIKSENIKTENISLLYKQELPIEAEYLDVKNKEDMKPPCTCPEECGNKFTQETRVKIYEHFWLKLKSWEERKLFIINTIEKDRYTSIRTFVLPTKDGGHITVCQEMYTNTLSLSEKSVESALPTNERNNSVKRVFPANYIKLEPHTQQKVVNTPELNHVSNYIKLEPYTQQKKFHTAEINNVSNYIKLESFAEQKDFNVPVSNHVSHYMKPCTDQKEFNTPAFNNVSTSINTKLNYSKDATKEFYPVAVKRIKLEFTPLKPPCACELQCRIKLTEDIRQQIHREFWNLPAKVDQKHFILSTIQVQINRNKITKEKTQEIKYFMLPYQYDNIVVCKEMYLHTLTISEDFVTSTIKNVNHDGSIIEDEDIQNLYEDTLHGMDSERKPVVKQTLKIIKTGPDDRDFINCADLLESQIKEDVLHSEKSEVKKIKKTRTSKKMGPPCPTSCRHRCNSKFTEEQRQELHDKFWESNWQGRKQFVMNTVKEFPIKNRSIPGRLTKRNFSRIYTLPSNGNKITVCQKMFFNTLSVCSKFVATVHIWASQVKW